MGSFGVSTKKREELVDITSPVYDIVSKTGIKNGIVIIYAPHTTSAITINENADPDVRHDILLGLKSIVCNIPYRHIEGNSDAHLKSSLIGSSVSVILENGRLKLGTWQGIYFCEFDGPRQRNVLIKVLGD